MTNHTGRPILPTKPVKPGYFLETCLWTAKLYFAKMGEDVRFINYLDGYLSDAFINATGSAYLERGKGFSIHRSDPMSILTIDYVGPILTSSRLPDEGLLLAQFIHVHERDLNKPFSPP